MAFHGRIASRSQRRVNSQFVQNSAFELMGEPAPDSSFYPADPGRDGTEVVPPPQAAENLAKLIRFASFPSARNASSSRTASSRCCVFARSRSRAAAAKPSRALRRSFFPLFEGAQRMHCFHHRRYTYRIHSSFSAADRFHVTTQRAPNVRIG